MANKGDNRSRTVLQKLTDSDQRC